MRGPIIALVLLCTACTSTPSADTASSQKEAIGKGSSIENAVEIKATNSSEGIRAEYEWISKRHPEFKRESQALIDHDPKFYDKIEITTKDGTKRTYYFDVTSFFGKW